VDFRNAEIVEDSFCRIAVTSIYMEGILNSLDFDSIRRFVPRNLVIQRTPQFDGILKAIELRVQENFLASRIDGIVTVETLQLLTGFPEERIMRFLFAMKGLGGIDYAPLERRRRQNMSPESPVPEPQPAKPEPAPAVPRRAVPRAAESFFKLAMQAYQKGDYWSVRRLCNQAIELNPDEGKYHHLQGLALSQRSETVPLAEISFRKAIELDSANTEFKIDFANYLKQQGRVAEALKECESIDPENPKVAAMLLSLKRMMI
jgi:tetratricopeptide (TPR) repeat protein